MYVTAAINRQTAVQCYVPHPVWPKLSKPHLDQLLLVQKVISQSDEIGDLTLILRSLTTDRIDIEDRQAGVKAACLFLAERKRLDAKTLLQANALINGAALNGFSYRKTFVWAGGPRPEFAWHVGSPPGQVPQLISALLKNAEQSSFCPTAVGIVSMIRLLQIHPFSDGNGRTARAVLWWHLNRSLGPRAGTARLLQHLWRRNEFDIHSASNDVRDHEDWGALVDRVSHYALQQ